MLLENYGIKKTKDEYQCFISIHKCTRLELMDLRVEKRLFSQAKLTCVTGKLRNKKKRRMNINVLFETEQ